MFITAFTSARLRVKGIFLFWKWVDRGNSLCSYDAAGSNSKRRKRFFLFSKLSSLNLGVQQPRIHWVLGFFFEHSSSSSTKVINE